MEAVEERKTLLVATQLTKTFGAVEALKGVDLTVSAGEVVALVGDNGAGKSTLVKTLAGAHRPDTGQIFFERKPVSLGNPAASVELGIATIYQDLALCDHLDVVANLYLGRERHNAARLLSEREMELKAIELVGSLSTNPPPPRALVRDLSGGQRQVVAIARALLAGPKVVLLDEPTAALGVSQTRDVLELIRALRARGLGCVLISHNLDDIFAVADRICVLRLGANAAEFTVSGCSREAVVASITGATPSDQPPPWGGTQR
ncbi:MAG: ATP-binding protein [Amycolatopsis sp.]|uniref:ATP-binding cassette domain-containing protein n=1 Tax=Amycolatopsis sp. TaxID=37632 RepID=UPI0026197800|nr:ATP-binding cassette domain-containing protein [Amycolatopsis sp.]MCU1682622.1 ATP-binding protein [Amycolatopsis sp.]